jgi:hypothetical protein
MSTFARIANGHELVQGHAHHFALNCAARRFRMNWASVIVAPISALAHATNFSMRSWPFALGQQLYAFAMGVFYAY